MKELVNVFNFDGYQIRTILQDGEPWFVASEVASALGYEKPQNAIAMHCKYAKILNYPEAGQLTSSPRGISIIPEGDVYRLTMRSRLDSAVRFQDWVTDEVLPAIRKTGSYKITASEMTEVEAAEQYLAIAQKYVEVVKEKERLSIELVKAQPKIEKFDVFIGADDLFTVDQVAKNLGVGPIKLRALMRELGFLRADTANWNLPKAPIMAKKLMTVKVTPIDMGGKIVHKSTAYFTSKGYEWISNVLASFKENNQITYNKRLVA